jgi:2-phosphoglycerate kinase
MNCDVLLIGGHSTSGKSTVALQLGKRFGIPVLQVDDFRLGIQRITQPGQIPGLHFFLQPEKAIFSHPISELVERHVQIATRMSHAMEAIIAHHVLVRQPIIIEGDGLLPTLCNLQEIDGVTVVGRIRSLFLIGRNRHEFAAACQVRWPDGAGAYTDNWIDLAWEYGQWMRQECAQHGIPVVASTPWATLEDRVMATNHALG